jgi:hypothetical protein
MEKRCFGAVNGRVAMINNSADCGISPQWRGSPHTQALLTGIRVQQVKNGRWVLIKEGLMF